MVAAPYKMNGTALVTGAASGIGRATCLVFAQEGVPSLILADMNLAGLQETAKLLTEINSEIKTVAVETNVSDEASVQNMVDEGVKAFGSIHYAVNCAGITSTPRVKTAEMEVDSYDRVIAVNLRGVWLCHRAVIRQMLKQEPVVDADMRTGARRERGSIVSIASVVGIVGDPTCGSYSAAKAGVISQVRTDAAAYGPEGIRLNAVCPGIIHTPILENSMKLGRPYKSMADTVPINRMGKSEEVAQMSVFLCSTRASYVTAQDICVDGGLINVLRSKV